MKKSELVINLDLPPSERWSFLIDYKKEIDALLACYLSDFKDADLLFESIAAVKNEIVAQEYLEEIESIASVSDFDSDQVLVANLYYDILKFYLGCTAFAVDTPNGVLHARNLDWWTENNILSDHSRIFDFQRNGVTVFKTVGWFGFIGALSGMKPGLFSVTLNAVSSDDAPEIGMPVSFLIRDVLDKCQSFETAKSILQDTAISSDCLLLLVGTQSNEKVVIERSPSRSATRESRMPYIVVANDYRRLENSWKEESLLSQTSCGRYDRACELLETTEIRSSGGHFLI